MATVSVRLFAAAREAAGRGSDTLDGATLGDVLERARAVYGPHFASVLEGARVWINGDEPEFGAATSLQEGDEVAVLPPVSGG